MCMFAGPPIQYVSGTKIYAGARPGGRQVLVYSMTVSAKKPVAMILPVPVPAGSGEDALQFIDLSGYRDFLLDLDGVFAPVYMVAAAALGGTRGGGDGYVPPLRVHTVGAFEASFVPTIDDFDRLDPRFQLDASIWDALPDYRDHGFAVFQLIDVARRSFWHRLIRRGKAIHPMAFEFPRRDPDALFFPTVHVHDGQVHAEAEFDHQLYAQAPGDSLAADPDAEAWEKNAVSLDTRINTRKASALIDIERSCWRRTMKGTFPNRDVYVRH